MKRGIVGVAAAALLALAAGCRGGTGTPAQPVAAKPSPTPAPAITLEQALSWAPRLQIVFSGRVTRETAPTTIEDVLKDSPRIKITAVFHGDSEQREFVPDRRCPPLQPGASHIFFVAYGTIHVFPDTEKNREILRAGLARNLQEDLDRRQHPFLDVPRTQDEAEKLLRDFLAKVARRNPDHPYLGLGAVNKVEVRRNDSPPGVYCRIVGGLEETEAPQGRQPNSPRSNAVVFWTAISFAHNGVFSAGFPAYRKDLKYYPQMRKSLWGPSNLFTFEYQAGQPEDATNVLDNIFQTFHSMSEKYRALCEHPPQRVEEALACLKGRPKTTRAGGLSVSIRWFAAFKAIEAEHVTGRLTEEQRRQAIPVLLDLLLDGTLVRDESPLDGPRTHANQMAYSLLVKLTGQKLPSPIQTRFVGRGRSLEEMRKEEVDAAGREKRLAAWRDWWAKAGGAKAPPSATPKR